MIAGRSDHRDDDGRAFDPIAGEPGMTTGTALAILAASAVVAGLAVIVMKLMQL